MFNILNLKPNKVSTNLTSYTSMVYGNAKAGKSTLAYNLFKEEGLFLGFEDGTRALAGAYAIPVTSWDDLTRDRKVENPETNEMVKVPSINKQLKDVNVKAKFKVLIIDTVDIMHKYALKHVCLKEGVQSLGDIPHGKGYQLVDDLIFDMIKTWENLGYKLFFISHAKEKSEKLPTGGEIQKYIPSVERRTLNIVSKFVDNILFGYLSINAEGQEVRTLYTRETLSYSAGSRFATLPSEIPFDAKIFKEVWKEAVEKESRLNPDGFTSAKKDIVKERKVDFNKTMDEIKNLVINVFNKNGRMDLVTDISEKNLGIGKKVTECTEKQADILEIILEEMKSTIEQFKLS